jgi:hypothetical protein
MEVVTRSGHGIISTGRRIQGSLGEIPKLVSWDSSRVLRMGSLGNSRGELDPMVADQSQERLT